MACSILIDEAIFGALEAFRRLGNVRTFRGDSLHRADLAGVDALIVRSVTPVGAELLEGTDIRFVATASSGTDHIDIDYVQRRGIHFASAPGCNARTVAEYVLTAVLWFARQRNLDPRFMTLGIIGVGHVGSTVAEWADALGMSLLLCDPPKNDAGQPGPWSGIEAVLEQSDCVTLHVPLTGVGPYATRNLLSDAAFDRLKHGAFLINTARGGVVDEDALIPALEAGRLGGAAIDVWSNEPDVRLDVLERCDVATPHVAGYSREAKRRAAVMVFKQLAAWIGVGAIVTSADDPGRPDRKISANDTAKREASGACDELDERTMLLEIILPKMISACNIIAATLRMKASAADRRSLARTFNTVRREWAQRREFPAIAGALASRIPRVERFLAAIGFC